jgi:hypothetical protein
MTSVEVVLAFPADFLQQQFGSTPLLIKYTIDSTGIESSLSEHDPLWHTVCVYDALTLFMDPAQMADI